MLNKECKLTITISVDTTELDKAIKEMQKLHELQEKVNSNSNEVMTNGNKKRAPTREARY